MSKSFLYIYCWLMAMFFGAVLSETVMLYPNIFYNVPDSLPAAMNFLKKMGPGKFFPWLGSGILLIGILTILFNWKTKNVSKYLLLSFVLMLLFEFLFSYFYFWPRNKIMFVEGASKHSAEELIRVANEFQLGHWIRLSVSCLTSCFAFMALHQSFATDTNKVVPFSIPNFKKQL